MFIEINEKNINKYYIVSVSKENTSTFEIIYKISNGEILLESFTTAELRDTKYNSVIA